MNAGSLEATDVTSSVDVPVFRTNTLSFLFRFTLTLPKERPFGEIDETGTSLATMNGEKVVIGVLVIIVYGSVPFVPPGLTLTQLLPLYRHAAAAARMKSIPSCVPVH